MSPSSARRRIVARALRLALAVGAAAPLGPTPALAAKTDLVILRNGDRITGEVKGLLSGKLDYSTDDAGRLSIEWDKVAKLTSPHPFQVELASGIRFLGRFGVSDRDGALVVVSDRVDTLEMAGVVEISPLSAGFLQRLQSYLDIGLTLAKANKSTTFSLSGLVEYRGPQLGSQLKFDSYAQGQETVPTTARNSIRGAFSWYLPDRWSVVGVLQYEQNDELDLDYRFTGGGGMSRSFYRTNQGEFNGAAGLVGTREKFGSQPEGSSNLEGLLLANWNAFRFDSPKLDFETTFVLFPSLTEAGRVRGQLELRLKYELFSDFMAGILFSDTFDNRPPDENASKNDYVTTLTIGWSYRR